MKINHLVLSAIIAPFSIVTLVACSSDSDDDSDINAVEQETINSVLLFDEANDGDIVDDRNNPQPLQFVVGENRVNGSTVSPDLDYLTVNVPAGSELTAIELADFTSTDDQSFIAIQAGSVFTEPNNGADPSNLLGYVHFGADMVGDDILAAISVGEGAQGFTPPLEAGDYSFWIQETGAELVNYSMVFVVEATEQ